MYLDPYSIEQLPCEASVRGVHNRRPRYRPAQVASTAVAHERRSKGPSDIGFLLMFVVWGLGL